MAAVSQTITPAPTIELFAGLPRGENNVYPRARVLFRDFTAITLKAAGNTNAVIYNCSLPANYAYRLDTFGLSFRSTTSTEVTQFEVLGDAALSLTPGLQEIRMQLKSEGLVSASTVAGGELIWNLQNRFSEVFQSLIAGAQCVFQANVFDNDGANETVAQNGAFHLSVLQYDIEQIVNVAVNAPLPVSSV